MEIKLKDEFIKLGQALKAAGLVDSGVVAKIVIQDGEVLVNGEVETRRGKKLYGGEVVSFDGQEIRIVKQCGSSMIIKSLELKNYRNYDELSMNFASGTNLLYGDNAQGKTNILESIYLSATTKSHRGKIGRAHV